MAINAMSTTPEKKSRIEGTYKTIFVIPFPKKPGYQKKKRKERGEKVGKRRINL
jgi:hypothetical protein